MGPDAISSLVSGSAYASVDGDVCLPTRLASSFVGDPEKDATTTAKAVRLTVRIAGRDGRAFPVSADIVSNRLNLSISGGVVTTASVG